MSFKAKFPYFGLEVGYGISQVFIESAKPFYWNGLLKEQSGKKPCWKKYLCINSMVELAGFANFNWFDYQGLRIKLSYNRFVHFGHGTYT